MDPMNVQCTVAFHKRREIPYVSDHWIFKKRTTLVKVKLLQPCGWTTVILQSCRWTPVRHNIKDHNLNSYHSAQ